MDKRVTLQVSAAIVVGVLVVIAVLRNFLPDRTVTAVTSDGTLALDSTVVGDRPSEPTPPPPSPPLDTAAYDAKLRQLAHVHEPVPMDPVLTETAATSVPIQSIWPVTAAYPNPGAILPFSRIVAYYGNFYSRGMGVLGKYDPDEMLQRLDVEVKKCVIIRLLDHLNDLFFCIRW